MQESNLTRTNFVKATVEGTTFVDCCIFGIAAWDLTGEPRQQYRLSITPLDKSPIRVDSLEVAQFLYLLLYNEHINKVVDSVTTRIVLVLGRFTPKRKEVLDQLSQELRRRDKIPVVFDFDQSPNRTLTETVSILAHLAQFIVADLSDPRCVPHELATIIPTLTSVPVQPIIATDSSPYAMFEDLRRYPWVLEPFVYENASELMSSMIRAVIEPAERYLASQKGSWWSAVYLAPLVATHLAARCTYWF